MALWLFMSIWADLSMIFPFGLWLLLKQFILSTFYSDNISKKEKKKMLIFEIFFHVSIYNYVELERICDRKPGFRLILYKI